MPPYQKGKIEEYDDVEKTISTAPKKIQTMIFFGSIVLFQNAADFSSLYFIHAYRPHNR